MEVWKTYQEENKGRFLNELIELLSIPSVSADPKFADDVFENLSGINISFGNFLIIYESETIFLFYNS